MASTVESCLDLLQKSDLLTCQQLAQARESAKECEDSKTLLRGLVQREFLTRWQANVLLAGGSTFRLGKYKLLDRLGRGGGGSVFLAEHTTMNRRVALKTIPRQLGRDSAQLDRFLVEARTIAALDHPNIVHAYDLDKEGDRHFMVLEFVEGRDLQRMVEADGPLDYRRAADFIRQAAEGLDHAHSRKMIHCDVKPSNLLVNSQGVVKILDLGMARLIDAHAKKGEASGQEEGMLGTVDYVAPEQAMRSPDMDHRVDIYSLGATLYFLLTGHAPFPGGSLAEKILKHQTAEPQSILEQRPGAPRDLVKICEKMMAKNPADRYQTAAEVASVLAKWRPPKQKVRKAVALDDADENPEQAFDLASLTANRLPGPAKPGSDKDLTGKSSSAGKKAPAKSDAAKPGAEPPSPLPWYRRPIVLWGGGAALVILGLAVGAVVMMLNSESPAVQKPSEKPPAATSPTATSPTATSPTPTSPMATSPTPAVPKPKKPPPKDNDDDLISQLILNPGNKSKPPSKQPSKTPGGSGKPVEVASVPSKEPPSATPSPTPTPTPTPSPTPTPTPTPSPTPTPTPTPAPAPTPAPTPTPPPKPEIKASLAELPKVVDLPATDSPGPSPVGKISTPPGVKWQLALVGGEGLFKNARRKLVLEEKDPGPDKPSWQVALSETSAAGENKEQALAKFFRDGDILTFQWLPDADQRVAGLLPYCALAVQVGDDKKTVGLIKPKVVKPLVIDLQKPAAQRKVEMDDVPQGKLWLEIVKLEGANDFDKTFTVDKPKPLAPKARGSLGLTMKSHPNKVDFPLMLVVNKAGFDVSLKVSPQIVAACKNPPADMELAKRNLTKQRDDARGKIEPAKTVSEKLQWTNKSNAYDVMLAGLEFFEAANKVKVHFRVYLDAGEEQKIVLATTEGP
jgi:serine/threonine protein kinase